MEMRVTHEISKAQENQCAKQLRDPRVAKDFFTVGVHPGNELVGGSHGPAPMEGGGWESGARLPRRINLARHAPGRSCAFEMCSRTETQLNSPRSYTPGSVKLRAGWSKQQPA